MKKLSLLFLIALCALQSATHCYAQKTASWYYTYYSEAGTGFHEYEYVKTIKDTVIDNLQAEIIEQVHIGFFDSDTIHFGREIIRRAGNQWYVFANNKFNLLYDFDAKAGDTITVLDEPFTGFFQYNYLSFTKFEYKIDSIKNELISGKIYPIQYISTTKSSDWSLYNLARENGAIIIGVGNRRIPLLGQKKTSGSNFNEVGNLRCYSINDTLKFKNYDKACDYRELYSTSNIQPINQAVALLNSYPNPANSTLNINDDGITNIKEAQIIDLTGRIITLPIQHNSIDISGLAKGLFMLRIGSSTTRFVKE